ncbi:MAG: hypothetical protein LLF76_12475 [Planctomycetaceae bacterium]|nr:hypothetical protein [Planctomycetaceae bacterium]
MKALDRQYIIKFLAIWVNVASVAFCAEAQPYIGYAYPAGGRQGTEVFVTVAGQFLRTSRQVHISGQGVHATIIEHYPPIVNLQKEQRDWIIDRIKEAADLRRHQDPADKTTDPNAFASKKKPEKLSAGMRVPDHPLLYGLEKRSLRELAHIQSVLLRPRQKIQPNRQIGELVLIKLMIDPGAQPGPRDLRIVTAAGLTNPIAIQIGTFSESLELEPNDTEAYPDQVLKFSELPKEKSLQLPVTVNGQILPRDVDRFRFHAQAGEKLVIQTSARSLIPYLADAVPGWFQAVAALYDAAGKEIAFADDYHFDPDPVLYYEIARTGDYELMIHDAVYRGLEDFVYRVSIGQMPFITEMFPLGGKLGQNTNASVKGWNLPADSLSLDTSGQIPGIRKAVLQKDGMVSNAMQYEAAASPQVTEADTHNTLQTAQSVSVPSIVDGKISAAGQSDIYRFQGKKGEAIAVTMMARRLSSPLDSLVRVMDAAGMVIGWNDDHSVKDKQFLFQDTDGLLTHHADSILSVDLPCDGSYFVEVTDSQGHGGSDFAYRLHIEPRTADFALRICPSGLSAPPGVIAPFTVHVLPENGFNADIEMHVKNTAGGFELLGGVIPAGKDSIRMAVRVPAGASGKTLSLELEGTAKIKDRLITRQAFGADDKMQAFLYRHLVPSQEVVVAGLDTARPFPHIELSETETLEIAQGSSGQLVLKTPARLFLKEASFGLQEPPEGFALRDITPVPQGLRLSIKVDQKVEVGRVENLVLEVSKPRPGNNKAAKPAGGAGPRFSAAVAVIPVRVTKPSPAVTCDTASTGI